MLLHSYFAIRQAPLCGGVLASLLYYYNANNFYKQSVDSHQINNFLKYVTGFGKISLNAANNFFQYPRVKPYGSIFLEKNFMAEMDRHQLALAYDAVVVYGELLRNYWRAFH